MKKLLTIILLALIFSCSPKKNNSTSTDNVSIDSVTSAVSDIEKPLSTNSTSITKPDSGISYGTELADQKKECYRAFSSIKTSKDFLTAYHLLNQLETDMNAQFDKIDPNLDYNELSDKTDEMMGNRLPWISVELVAEGTIPVSAINNRELEKSALLSPETDDDQFVNLLINIFGESGSSRNGIPSWNTMQCDGCVSSLLGNGETVKIFKKADSLKSYSPRFSNDVDSLISGFFNRKESIFESQKDEILDEIDTILAVINLSDSQKKVLNVYLEAVSDTSLSHVQINCADGHCRY